MEEKKDDTQRDDDVSPSPPPSLSISASDSCPCADCEVAGLENASTLASHLQKQHSDLPIRTKKEIAFNSAADFCERCNTFVGTLRRHLRDCPLGCQICNADKSHVPTFMLNTKCVINHCLKVHTNTQLKTLTADYMKAVGLLFCVKGDHFVSNASGHLVEDGPDSTEDPVYATTSACPKLTQKGKYRAKKVPLLCPSMSCRFQCKSSKNLLNHLHTIDHVPPVEEWPSSLLKEGGITRCSTASCKMLYLSNQESRHKCRRGGPIRPLARNMGRNMASRRDKGPHGEVILLNTGLPSQGRSDFFNQYLSHAASSRRMPLEKCVQCGEDADRRLPCGHLIHNDCLVSFNTSISSPINKCPKCDRPVGPSYQPAMGREEKRPGLAVPRSEHLRGIPDSSAPPFPGLVDDESKYPPIQAEHFEDLLIRLSDHAPVYVKLWPRDAKRFALICGQLLSLIKQYQMEGKTNMVDHLFYKLLELPSKLLLRTDEKGNSRSTKKQRDDIVQTLHQMSFPPVPLPAEREAMAPQEEKKNRDAPPHQNSFAEDPTADEEKQNHQAPVEENVKESPDIIIKRIIGRLTDLTRRGFAGKGLKEALSNGIYPWDSDTIRVQESLQKDHLTDAQIPRPPAPEYHNTYQQPDSRKAAMSNNRGQSGGPSGWSPEHLIALFSSDESSAQTHWLMNCIDQNNLTDFQRYVLTAGQALALKKTPRHLPRQQGEVHRPLATNEVFLSATIQRSMNRHQSVLPKPFQSVAKNICFPGGVEAAFRMVETWIFKAPSEDLNDDRFVLFTDLRNAFNSLNRILVLKEAYRWSDLKGMYSLIDLAYGRESPLVLSKQKDTPDIIYSRGGVRQGCKLGSFLFCLTVHPLWMEVLAMLERWKAKDTTRISEEDFTRIKNPSTWRSNSNNVATAITDDFAFGGSARECLFVLKALKKLAPSLGLQLVLEKCKLFAPHNDPCAEVTQSLKSLNVPIVGGPEALVVFAGAPLSLSKEKIISWLQEQVDSHQHLWAILRHPDLPSQAADHLIRTCAQPRLNHLLRMLPPEFTTAGPADSFYKSSLHTLLSRKGFDPNHVPDRAFNQISLPVRYNGYGLSDPRLIAPLAYYSSVVQTLFEVRKVFNSQWVLPRFLQDRIRPVQKLIQEDLGLMHKDFLPKRNQDILRFYTKTHQKKKIQNSLTDLMYRQLRLAVFCEEDSDSDLVVAHKQAHRSINKEQSLWMRFMPNEPTTFLSDAHFDTMFCVRFCLDPAPSRPRWCGCGVDTSDHPLHLLDCRSLIKTEANSRHDHIRDILVDVARNYGLRCKKEPRARPHDDQTRTDASFDFIRKGLVHIDVSVVDPLAASHRQKEVSSLLLECEADKATEYKADLHDQGIRFFPFVLAATGQWGACAKAFLKELVKVISGTHQLDFKEEAYLKHFIKVSIGSALAKGNAMCLHAQEWPSPGAEVIQSAMYPTDVMFPTLAGSIEPPLRPDSKEARTAAESEEPRRQTGRGQSSSPPPQQCTRGNVAEDEDEKCSGSEKSPASNEAPPTPMRQSVVSVDGKLVVCVEAASPDGSQPIRPNPQLLCPVEDLAGRFDALITQEE